MAPRPKFAPLSKDVEPVILVSGPLAQRPDASGQRNIWYLATDTGQVFTDWGTGWTMIASSTGGSGGGGVSTNTLTAAANAIISTVEGIAATLTPAAGTIAAGSILGFNAAGNLVKGADPTPAAATTNSLTAGSSAITSNVNGTSSTLTPAAGTVDASSYLGFDASGALVKGATPAIPATTNALTAASAETITSTVDGVAAALAPGAGTIDAGKYLGFDSSGALVKGNATVGSVVENVNGTVDVTLGATTANVVRVINEQASAAAPPAASDVLTMLIGTDHVAVSITQLAATIATLLPAETFLNGASYNPATSELTLTLNDAGTATDVVVNLSDLIPVTSQNSITGAGTGASPLQLAGDLAVPGNDVYYGTDGSGTRGFHALPPTPGAGDIVFVPFGNIAATDVEGALRELDTEKSDVSHVHAAAAVTFAPGGNIAATDVQAAIAELDTEKADAAHVHNASAVTFTPAGGIAATDVAGALAELDTEKAAAAHTHTVDIAAATNSISVTVEGVTDTLTPAAGTPDPTKYLGFDAGGALVVGSVPAAAATTNTLTATGADTITSTVNGTAANLAVPAGTIAATKTLGFDSSGALVAGSQSAAGTTSLPLGNLAAANVQDALYELQGDIDLLAGAVFKGGFDASSGSFPAATSAGWWYITTTAGVTGGVSFNVGDQLWAVVNTPSTSVYAANWVRIPVGAVPAYVDTFVAADWAAGTGVHTLSYTALTHGQGVAPFVLVQFFNSTDYEAITVEQTMNGSGDVTLTVPSGLQFDGRVLISSGLGGGANASLMGGATANGATPGTAGTVTAPGAGDNRSVLRGDGTWGANVPAWEANTFYKQGAAVISNGGLYTRNANGTSTGLFATDATNWTLIAAQRAYGLVTNDGAFALPIPYGDMVAEIAAVEDLTFDLPPAASSTAMQIRFVRTDATAFTTTIAANGTDTIAGASTYVLSNQFDSVTLVSNGVGRWLVF